MADPSQTVSSQPRLTEGALNKSLSPKPKPPLLPKPQLSASNLKNGKASPVKKIQTSSQTVISVKSVIDGSGAVDKQQRDEAIVLNSLNASPVINASNSVKPPALYPKPKLPPKTNAFKVAHPNGSQSPTSVYEKKQSEVNNSLNGTPVRPPRSPKKILKDNPLEELVLVTPEAPLDFPERRQKSASLPRSEFSNWTLRELNKNSKSPIKYFQQVNSVISADKREDSSKDGVQASVPTPRPRIKTRSKFHIALDLAANLQEREIPVYATVDYSKKKKNRQNGSGGYSSSSAPQLYHSNLFITESSGSSSDVDSSASGESAPGCSVQYSNERGDDDNSPNLGCYVNDNDYEEHKTRSTNQVIDHVNGNAVHIDTDPSEEESCLNAYNNNYNSFNSNYNVVTNEVGAVEESRTVMSVEEDTPGRNNIEREDVVPVPQSFLHRHVGSAGGSESTPRKSNGTIEDCSRGDDAKAPSSFLYKHSGKSPAPIKPEGVDIPRLDNSETSAISPGDVSEADHSNFLRTPVTRRNSEQGLPLNRENNLYEAKDPSPESSPRTSSCSTDAEGSNLGKRFPWFGSFGKGNKKRSEKKERCSSQFYASPVKLDETDTNIQDCARTKSLPNIKSNDKAADGDDSSTLNDWSNRNTESLNSEYSTLTHNSDADDDKESVNDVEIVADNGKKANKAFLIAKELMTSEEVFIDVLKLLNVDFRNFVEQRNRDKGSVLPQSNLNRILNHLPELQTLNEVLLSDLKKRIDNWETNPKISDVIVKKGAFLKLYTSYIQNFESQTKHLDECVIKYPKFGKILREFESLDICRMLSLKHYMLKPVQRIPQYRLLLSDYLKHIDESSPDYEDTENAIKIVSEVADHVNRNLKFGDKNGTLMHFQSLLSDYELIRPGRELIKDGPLEKICRKTVKDRYFILLNDCFLHTTYSKSSLKIHQELPLVGMKVCCNDEHKHRYSFAVYSTTRSFILCAKSECERNDWVQSLQSAIEEYISRQKTFMNVRLPETDTFKLGKEAPVWIQDSKVTMCQICTAEFTSLFRRHHCRACGKVICKYCGGSQAPLQYDSFKPHRVCEQCFPKLLKDYEESEDEIYELLKLGYPGANQDIQNIYLNNKAKFIKCTSNCKPKFIPPRLKEVSANDTESEMNGLLYRKLKKGWKEYWYVLKEHVLYVYRASEDVIALETIPVLGYEVQLSDVNLETVDKSLIFLLSHRHQQPMIFHADTEEAAERWYKALKKAIEFEELSSS